MTEPSLHQLENTKDELLRAIQLPERLAVRDVPSCLQDVDVQELVAILEKAVPAKALAPGPETQEFITDFIERSDEGLRLWLTAEIDLYLAAKESLLDQSGHNDFGLFQAIYPVVVRGQLVHALIAGPFHDRPFTGEEITKISEISGKSAEQVEEAARHVPVLSPGHRTLVLNLFALSRDALQVALAERAAASYANHQLLQAERDRSLGALSGGVAHHFNNLLSVVLGYSSFVLNREDHSKEAASALHKIAEAAQKGRRLTEEILAFSGSGDEEEESCAVHETLSSVLSLMETELSSTITMEKSLSAENDTVITTPRSIHQLIFNLLNHALDSMPEGGALTVSTENTNIDSDGAKREYLRLEVTDTGGMAPATAEERKAGKNGGQHTDEENLRLSNVYGMVGRLDGTVMVTTEPGSLTRVEVLLPTAGGAETKQAERKVKRRLAPSAIWVIDDDKIFREMCHQVLSEEGHSIVELTGGEALKNEWNRSERPPNLIVMDFSMPECNGLELCEWLKSEGSLVPVILVSGFNANQPDIKKALRIKKTYFLQKPFTSRDLTDAVTLAMGETLIGETLLSEL